MVSTRMMPRIWWFGFDHEWAGGSPSCPNCNLVMVMVVMNSLERLMVLKLESSITENIQQMKLTELWNAFLVRSAVIKSLPCQVRDKSKFFRYFFGCCSCSDLRNALMAKLPGFRTAMGSLWVRAESSEWILEAREERRMPKAAESGIKTKKTRLRSRETCVDCLAVRRYATECGS